MKKNPKNLKSKPKVIEAKNTAVHLRRHTGGVKVGLSWLTRKQP